MIKSEYIRNLNRNYERILLEAGVDRKRYQYCILDRGGIRHLLSCSYKCMNEECYLDYDISSRQNIRQVFSDKCVQREWMKVFLGSMKVLRQELNRFLLDERNILWSPEHIFQDLEQYEFRYIYLPYYGQEGANEEGFEKLLEFWVERADYEDDGLVEFIYHAYDQYMQSGQSYLEKQIFEDFDTMEKKMAEHTLKEGVLKENVQGGGALKMKGSPAKEESWQVCVPKETVPQNEERKGLFSFLDSRKRKADPKTTYREEMRRMINGYAVCEEIAYDTGTERNAVAEEYGRTIYIEEEEQGHALYTEDGTIVIKLEKFPFIVGKRKEDVDYALADYASSRVHARFVQEEGDIYIEDLNSTNGTFKNGLRLLPYEKKKLEHEDSLRFGKSTFVYK